MYRVLRPENSDVARRAGEEIIVSNSGKCVLVKLYVLQAASTSLSFAGCNTMCGGRD